MSDIENKKDSFELIHNDAKAQAIQKMPEVDINEIILLGFDVLEKNKKPLEAAMILAEKYKEPAKAYLDIFESRAVHLYVDGLKEGKEISFDSVEFEGELISFMNGIASSIHRYQNKEINIQSLVSEIFSSQSKDLGNNLLELCGLDKKDGVKTVDRNGVNHINYTTLSYYAFVVAYQEVEKAKQEAREQHKKTEEIIIKCDNSIALITEFKEQMHESVETYMNRHLNVVNNAFRNIDKAILENDVNGYISGNIELQKLLGAEIQFSNSEEFDELMDSDEDFIL